MNKLNLLGVLMLLCVGSALGQSGQTLSGQLTQENQKALTDVLVRIKNTHFSTRTDNEGRFSFEGVNEGPLLFDIEVNDNQHYNVKINFDGTPVLINIDQLALDHLVVSANPLEHNLLRMTAPAAILDEETLIEDRPLSWEETLDQITGVNAGGFGAGSGQIVIRGQQGPRVTVLNNGVTNQDASTVSPDHWISVEPMLAQSVEVLKGPATLLYGGGAVGGVVNVVDDTIPSERVEGIHGGVEGRLSDSTLDEQSLVLSLKAGLSDNWVGQLSYFDRQTDDYEIPGYAESRILHESEEGEADHDDDDEEHEDEEEAFGLLENSSTESSGFNLGFSYVTDNGYWGVSYSDFERNYGIPGHEHHEDEHHDDGDHDDDDEEHGDDDEEHGEEEEIVRIDLDKSVFTFRGVHRFGQDGFLNGLRTHFTDTDYQHIELEGDEIGTVFDNQANEFRLELTHNTIGGMDGVFGVQFSNRDFSAIGEEAYILPSETQVWSLFLIEERDFDRWHGEFGLRYDHQEVDTNLFSTLSDDALSLSLGATFELNDHWTLPINLTSAQRLPTAEELFSNQSGADELIPHLATASIEIGNPDLQQETANNFDIGLKFRKGNVSANLAFFYNQLDDYIFLRATGEEEEETPIFVYTQQNATFKGYEADISFRVTEFWGAQWDFRLFTDGVDAELNTGEAVPRIPARRTGLDINWLAGAWSIGLDYVHVSKQDDVAAFELPTNSYEQLDLSVNWLHYGANTETMVFVKGANLLDEEIRDHASFIKDIAPRPGRSVTAGFRVTF